MRALLLAIALLSPTIGRADYIVESGSEFPVNTYTSYSQEAPAIAMRTDGSFVVVWTSEQEITDDPQRDRRGIYAQRFSAMTAPIGTEFVVNEFPCGLHGNPAVAAASDGSFVVAWQLNWGCRSLPEADIYARRFAADGQPLGTELVVNDHTSGEQYEPLIARLADDSFIVTWTSSEYVPDEPDLSQDGSDAGIFARRIDSNGHRLGTEFQVNTYTTSVQFSGIPAALGDGFVVVWNSGLGIRGQRFAPDGTAAGTEFVADSGNWHQHEIAVDAQRRMTIVWASHISNVSLMADPDSANVFGRRYDEQGIPIGTSFPASGIRTGQQQKPSVVHLPDSSFIVVWQDGPVYHPAPAPPRDGDEAGVFANRFTRDGAALYEDFLVNSYTPGHQAPRDFGFGPSAVASDQEGNFVVTWTDTSGHDGQLAGVFAQRYCVYDAGTACGDVDCMGDSLTATDALGLLRAAVGLLACDPCVCDVDGSGVTAATDALAVLRAASGLAGSLTCPSCG